MTNIKIEHSEKFLTGLYARNIRAQYRTGSNIVNAIITHFTGKPLSCQKPLFKPNARRSFWLCLFFLVAMPMAVYGCSLISLEVAYVVGYLAAVFQTGLFRVFQVQFGHHAAHRTFVRGSRGINAFYLNLATSIAFCQNGKEYHADHTAHHSRRIFTTLDDPDAKILFKFGIRPNMSRNQLWSRYWITLLSPRFHFYFLWMRVKTNFITHDYWIWKIFTLCWILVLATASYYLPTWIAVVTIILPLTVFYQMSALTQFITEHAWMASETMPKDLSSYAERCWGRFFGDPLPHNPLSLVSLLYRWPIYLFRLVFLHFPGRYAIIVGDMPAHDWHHFAGFLGMSNFAWPAATYERQEAVDNGDHFKMAEREIWGIDRILDHTFIIMSRSETLPDRPKLVLNNGVKMAEDKA